MNDIRVVWRNNNAIVSDWCFFLLKRGQRGTYEFFQRHMPRLDVGFFFVGDIMVIMRLMFSIKIRKAFINYG